MRNLFIFGFGFSSTEIARQSADSCDRIVGTTRSREKIIGIEKSGYHGLIFKGTGFSEELRRELADATHLVVSIAPREYDPVLAKMPDDLVKICPNLKWIGYLSTVGVYGNHDGAWVTEDTEPIPVSKRSLERLRAETAWQCQADLLDVPLAIFRLSGIYGPGRNAFINIEKGTARRLVKTGQVFNRIHREDIGIAVRAAMQLNAHGIFNITDNEPAQPQDVVTFACEIMGIEPPPETDFETAELSSMARSFYGENKRVSNAKSKTVLGMKYRWPDYRTALQRMWQDNSWK